MEIKSEFKVFGAALDVLDEPSAIQLKIAYLNSKLRQMFTIQQGKDKSMKLIPDYLDPYDALIPKISKLLKIKNITLIDKFPIDSQFTPKPKIQDLFKINQKNYTSFLESDNFRKYASSLEKFVENYISPYNPFMIGVDHSLSGGVISHLIKKYGKENLTIIIIDAHFDAIPSRIRKNSGGEISFPILPDNIYTSGNFLDILIKEKILLPENLIMIGVTDYPRKIFLKDNNLRRFAKYYLAFEEKGVKFITKKEVETDLSAGENAQAGKLDKILSQIKTKYIYLSLDVDVCANQGAYAVRFLDRVGMNEDNLYKIAKKINSYIQANRIKLAGLDLMEINVHFLGLKIKGKIKDRTLNICSNYLKNLLL